MYIKFCIFMIFSAFNHLSGLFASRVLYSEVCSYHLSPQVVLETWSRFDLLTLPVIVVTQEGSATMELQWLCLF